MHGGSRVEPESKPVFKKPIAALCANFELQILARHATRR